MDLHIFQDAAESLDGAGSTDPDGMPQKEKEKQYNVSIKWKSESSWLSKEMYNRMMRLIRSKANEYSIH